MFEGAINFRHRVFEAGCAVKEDDAFFAADPAILQFLKISCVGCRTLGAEQYALEVCRLLPCVINRPVINGGGKPAGFTDSLQNEEVAHRGRYTNPRGNRPGILPELGVLGSCLECFHDGGTAACLDGDHSWPPAVDPADCLEFIKGLYHAD